MGAKVLAMLSAIACVMSAHAVESVASAPTGRSASAKVRIAVTIPRILAMRFANHPATVDITSEDIARGEIIVRGARAQVIANVRGGYRLRANLASSPFAEAQIDGFEVRVHARPGITTLAAMPNAAYGSPEPRALEYRLKISGDALPGRYRWPVALSVQDP